MVKYLVIHKPTDSEYIHGIDHAKSRTQDNLIKAVSKGMGDTPIKVSSYYDSASKRLEPELPGEHLQP